MQDWYPIIAISLLALAAWATPCRYDPAIRLKERMERKRVAEAFQQQRSGNAKEDSE